MHKYSYIYINYNAIIICIILTLIKIILKKIIDIIIIMIIIILCWLSALSPCWTCNRRMIGSFVSCCPGGIIRIESNRNEGIPRFNDLVEG